MLDQPNPGVVYALKIVSGRYEGGMCPLKPERETFIGRQSDLDLVLAEDLVSRRHARITVRGGLVTLHDLGSTNGTFVNGRRVRETHLAEGDRVAIGGSLMVLSRAVPGSEKKTDARLLEGGKAAEARISHEPAGMRGQLEDVPLPDLLQLLGNGKKTGLLILRERSRTAQVSFQEGHVARCSVDGRTEVNARKSLFRLLSWEKGEFEFTPLAEESVSGHLEESIDALLLEGLRQLDELRAIKPPWTSASARLVPSDPQRGPLSDLTALEIDLFQWAAGGATIQSLLDRSPSSDLETVRSLMALIKKEYLRPE